MTPIDPKRFGTVDRRTFLKGAGAHNKVHGQNPAGYFGIYDVVRWDNGWLAS